MRYTRNLLLTTFIVLAATVFASAQTEQVIKNYFEGMRVDVRIDMPATKDGINVYPEREQDVDYNRYGKLIKENGVGVRENERIMITKIKVKDKHIEFQLGGGGYGTFGDESVPSTYVSSVSKSSRELRIERQLDRETDKRRRRQLREELDYLRDERARQDAYNQSIAVQNAEIASARIQEKRLQGGSRFNIKFDRKLTPEDLTPQAIMNALSEYVSFSQVP